MANCSKSQKNEVNPPGVEPGAQIQRTQRVATVPRSQCVDGTETERELGDRDRGKERQKIEREREREETRGGEGDFEKNKERK